MKIIIPPIIKQNLFNIKDIWFESVGTNPVKFTVKKIHAEKIDFIDIPNDIYNNAEKIHYKYELLSGDIEYVKFVHKSRSLYRGSDSAIIECIRQHKETPYSNLDDGWKICLQDLIEKSTEAEHHSMLDSGNKNLVYYTVYFNKGYVELFDLSVQTLLQQETPNYDILVITDNDTKLLIEKTNSYKNFNLKFHITETPKDGIEASKNKVNIFDYKHIYEYKNVLFLDCDIIAINGINKIFKEKIDHNTLYTAYNSNLNAGYFKSIHHGFECLPEDFVKEMATIKQIPFNAGQFLFRVSERMNKHFENVLWFMKNWPEEYFFEQCFMCYYFCSNYMTKNEILHPIIRLISTKNKQDLKDYNINKSVSLLHFIAPPLDAKTKLEFIEDFRKDFNLLKTSKLINLIKNVFKK